jgi:hypothetical protein
MLSREYASLAIQILGMLSAFLIGLARYDKSRTLVALGCIACGLVANVVGQILVAGGGPGAFCGFVVLPAYALVAGLLGRALGRWIYRPPVNNDGLGFLVPRCKKCGYCLNGLTERRCPECGTPF